jgi:hypothetical protein
MADFAYYVGLMENFVFHVIKISLLEGGLVLGWHSINIVLFSFAR